MLITRAAPTIVLTLACAIGLAACSGGSDKPTPTSAASPKQTTTPTVMTPQPTVKPTANGYNGPASVPVAARARTDAGRIAFAKHYIDEVNRTNQTPTPGVLEKLSLPTCKTCKRQIQTVLLLKRKNEHFIGDTYQVRRIEFPIHTNHNLVEAFCYGPTGKHVSKDGKIVEVFPEEKNFNIVFTMKWAGFWKVSLLQDAQVETP